MGGPTAALAEQPRPSPAPALCPWPSMQLAGRVAQRYLSTLPHGVSWVRIPLLACQSALRRCCHLLATLPARPPAIRRCCPLLASLPARPPAIRRCCPSPITLHARPPATQPLSSCFFLSTRSILPRAVGEDLTSPTRGTGAPKVPGRWSPPSSAPPQSPALAREALPSQTPCSHHSPLVQGNGRPTAALEGQPRPSPAPALCPWPSMQIAGRVAQRYLSTLPHGVSWVRVPLLACQSALRRCFLLPVSSFPGGASSPGR